MALSKSKIKYIQSLKLKKNRDEHNTFVAEGDKIVPELLPAMQCELLVATAGFINSLGGNGGGAGEVLEVSKEELARVSFVKSPQQVLAVFRQPRFGLEQIEPRRQLVLALDGIQDPGNMGTIIRLADWYGINDIVCSADTVDVYNPKVVQATMGALARVRVHYIQLEEWLQQQQGIPVYGTFLEGQSIYDSQISANGIIVMGNEGSGIRDEVKRLVTSGLYIPNYPEGRTTSESLNVGVATAIVCSEFRRRIPR